MPDNCPILEAHGVKLNDTRRGVEICQNCPLENRKRLRNQEVIRLFTTGGKSMKELAVIFNISPRTVQRAIRDYRSKKEVSK